MDSLFDRFIKHISENSLISRNDRVLLSLSAGKDSMFMLNMVLGISEEYDLKLGIFHLNHMMRGDESDGDESFVRETAEKLNIPAYIERYDFIKNRSKQLSFEEHARDMRYSFLNNLAASEGYSKIATAHNLNDNAETVLMRALTGTGIAGLKGISPCSGRIIRPVLFAKKDEIYSYLLHNSIAWREDASNSDNSYQRNFVRNRLFPLINERFIKSEDSLINLSVHAAENQELLFRLAKRLYPEAVSNSPESTIIRIDEFINDHALIKLFLGHALMFYYGERTKASIFNEIQKKLHVNSANIDLYENERIKVKKKLINGKAAIEIKKTGMNRKTGLWEYIIKPDRNETVKITEIKKELTVVSVDYQYYIENRTRFDSVFIQVDDSVEFIVIRNRRDGDRIAIENGTKKIKEIMIEKKLDSETKNRVPLIVADGQIAAYLPGLVISDNNNRVSCNFHIRDYTKRILAFFFRDY